MFMQAVWLCVAVEINGYNDIAMFLKVGMSYVIVNTLENIKFLAGHRSQ